MAIKSYPLLLVLDQSIEFIEDEKALRDATHLIDNASLKRVMLVYPNERCSNIQDAPVQCIDLKYLTELVQQYLIDEGQCCVSKIQLRNTQQAFDLLESLN
ncbi:DUF4144 family protein [Pseudoalteromonas piscicida]|uniref:Uncharacterized protein n=1 Tax=Pseudoalteromonas piscicida TaxID=43662 RepID=A0AAD0RKL1_PSEO7|nr:DUF4144 family protein [Pseudoalteromonas piscicida]ASD68384.1 hypothetical protein B1L02_16095 [Pseudoalteromonas piscicida]AXQ96803.1 hypothetical protein D0N37_02710 [Pseudoalteromonas piscicida]AXR03430.1 hypothetical protein D0511_16150 [Pseudoalteromonas piscicida]